MFYFFRKLIPKMDSNGDGFVEESELKEHINFMQKRYVDNDVDRTWKNYASEKIKDGKLSWKDYSLVSFHDSFFFLNLALLGIYVCFREFLP